MDFQSKKVLKYINKYDYSNFCKKDLFSVFPEISEIYLFEILNDLYKNEFIYYKGSNFYIKSTNKGKTYFNQLYSKWLSKNIVALLALIVSIIALFRTL